MRLIIIGASGLIGSYLMAAAAGAGTAVIGTFASRPGDGLLRFDLLQHRIGLLVPDLGPEDRVFLLSAHIQPDWVFRHPAESRALNVEATARCIDDVASRGSHIVFVSSESVFGEDRTEGCDEHTTPKPSTLYGQQKVEIENYLKERVEKATIVRTGWTVGWKPEHYCPIHNTYKALLSGNARMARDNFFTLTDVRDTVNGLLALANTSRTGVMHLASNPPMSRIGLADQIIRSSRSGANMEYEAVSYSSISFLEPRPRCAWIRSAETSQSLELDFGDAAATVVRKVALLDEWAADDEEAGH